MTKDAARRRLSPLFRSLSKTEYLCHNQFSKTRIPGPSWNEMPELFTR